MNSPASQKKHSFIFFDHMGGDTRRIEAILERALYGMGSGVEHVGEAMSDKVRDVTGVK